MSLQAIPPTLPNLYANKWVWKQTRRPRHLKLKTDDSGFTGFRRIAVSLVKKNSSVPFSYQIDRFILL